MLIWFQFIISRLDSVKGYTQNNLFSMPYPNADDINSA